MKTPNVKAMSESGFVISYVVDFLLIVQWIAVLICCRKQGVEPFQITVRAQYGSGSGLAPAQNILAVQVWFGFT